MKFLKEGLEEMIIAKDVLKDFFTLMNFLPYFDPGVVVIISFLVFIFQHQSQLINNTHTQCICNNSIITLFQSLIHGLV